jgi:uncharacterized protein (TIGR02246 family)
MRKTLIVLVPFLALGWFFMAPGGEGQTPPPAQAANDEQAIRNAVAAYGEAFNKGDLAGLAAVWAPDAEYVDESGKVTKGRDAIANLFRQFVADSKGAKMALKVTSVRLLKGDVAMQDGVATITGADGAVDEGRYSAVWFKTDGKWQIRSARDLPYDAADAPGAAGALNQLQWMVGDWEGEKGAVHVSVRWALNKAFLQQDYAVKRPEGDMSVMQLVGFDPLTGQIKSWTFDSLGGYGEGLWERDGNSWTVQTAGVLPGGQTGTGVNVIRFTDDQNVVFQSRDREVEGQPIPDAEITLVRKA